MPKPFTATGFEIYAGLHTIGVEEAGFKILGHLESTEYAVKTARLNFPEIDIRTNDDWGDLTNFFNSDYIFSNPPCAVWSSASKGFTQGRTLMNGQIGRIGKDAWRDDPRLDLHRNIHQVAQSLQPKAFVIESILNAWRHGREFWVDEIAASWADIGYSISFVLQNNQWIGAIQKRPRIFMVAHNYPLEFGEFTYPNTVHEILGKIKIPQNEKRWLKPWMKQLWEVAPKVSGSLARVVRDGLIKNINGESIPSFLCRRSRADEVPLVWLSDKTRLHYAEPRYHHWDEMLALAGMPEWWQTAANLDEASKELSRAVLPAAGKWIAESVHRGLKQRPMKTAEYTIFNYLDATNPYEEKLLFL